MTRSTAIKDCKDKSFRFFMFYLVQFMAYSSYFAFITVYLKGLGFGVKQLGLITAVTSCVALFSNRFWGMISDRAKYKNNVLLIQFIATFFIMFLFFKFQTFYTLLLTMSFLTFFQASIFSISSAMALEYTEDKKCKFGFVRLGGSMGYAIIIVISGYVVETNIMRIFTIPILLIPFAMFFSRLLPKIPGHQSNGHKKNYTELLKDARMIRLLLFSFVAFMTVSFYNNFFPIYLISLGARTETIGLSGFLAALAEMPFLLVSDKVIERFGIKSSMIFAAAASAIRWILVGTISNPTILLVLQVLHGCTFIVLYYTVSVYINKITSPELKASGQGLNSIVNTGLSSIAAGYLGGLLSSMFGMSKVFVLCGGALLIATITLSLSNFEEEEKSSTKLLAS